MTESPKESRSYRFDVDAIEKLQEIGRGITHNPKAVPNDCLYAVLGELEKSTKRVRELEKAMTRPTPAVQPV